MCDCNDGYDLASDGVECIGKRQLIKQLHVTGFVLFYFVDNHTDVDECESNVSVCHVNASCANTDGSFLCSCLSGFEGGGVICEGV